MSWRETCGKAAKKAYTKCGGKHGRCSTTRGKKVTCYKEIIVLKSIIPMITPEDDILPKITIVNRKLSDKEEYQVCSFIAGKIKAKLVTIR